MMKTILRVNFRPHINFRVIKQKLSLLIISRNIYIKDRKELRMKAIGIIYMLSLRNFKIESFPRSLNISTSR